MRKEGVIFIIFSVATVLLFVANLLYGAVHIPFNEVVAVLFGGEEINRVSEVILLSSRLPASITALLAGATLGASGLLLQTLFNNPLASPSILGVSSGAGVGVAVVTLLFGGALSSVGLYGHLAILLAAFIGAAVVLLIIIAFSTKVKSNVMLLVVGIMVGYMSSSVVTMLNFQAESKGVVSFIIWGMGDFTGVSNSSLIYFVVLSLIGIILSLLMIKPLNALLLGERYSQNLGVNIKRIRVIILLVTGILTAVVTAYCGPISFLGLAVPHIARLMLRTSSHGVLLPATLVIGSAMALLCNILTVTLFEGSVVPLNAITPLTCAPVIIYVIVNKNRISYFN